MKKNVINYEVCDLIRKSTKVEGEIADELAKLKIELYETPEWRHNDYLFVHTEKNLFFEISLCPKKGKSVVEFAKYEFERIERENNILDLN